MKEGRMNKLLLYKNDLISIENQLFRMKKMFENLY